MSRPIKKRSHIEATEVGPGKKHLTRSHTSIGILVIAYNLDPANDSLTVSLEGGIGIGKSDEETILSPIYLDHSISGTKPRYVSEDEFEDDDGDGDYQLFVFNSSVPVEAARCRITEFNDAAGDDLSVDSFVLAASNSGGTGYSFESDS